MRGAGRESAHLAIASSRALGVYTVPRRETGLHPPLGSGHESPHCPARALGFIKLPGRRDRSLERPVSGRLARALQPSCWSRAKQQQRSGHGGTNGR
jgi:hypothetical protein